jgi:DNA repair protein RecO (recombination protein O)
MEQHRHQLESGYLLHQRPYGDADAVLEIFSRDHGRVGLIAKGVRSGRSRRAGMLQPFGELLLSWVAKGELGSLREVEPAQTPPVLAGTAMVSGFYLNELLMRLLRRADPHAELYDDYRRSLHLLAGGTDQDYTLRVFEKQLLAGLGYGLLLEHDVEGRPVVAEAHYQYLAERGPQRVAGASTQTVPGAALLALAQESPELTAYARELRGLLRAALAPHLGEQPLKSRELYRQFVRRQ